MLRALPRAAAGIAASLALQQTCQQSDDRLARWRKRWEGDTRGWELGKTVHPRLAEFDCCRTRARASSCHWQARAMTSPI